MIINQLHYWKVTPREAVEIQNRLKKKIIERTFSKKIRLVAGADVAFPSDGNTVQAAVTVLSFPDMEVVERKRARVRLTFPYIPGLLSFREGPALIKCFKKIKNIPDVIVFDGHGIAHPRGIGIAAHMGILVDTPSIGCAKSPLFGNFKPPPQKKGAYTFVRDKRGNVIGACVRTRTNVKPVFISIGNRITLDKAIEIILECSTKYRLPEPVRQADKLSKSA